MRIPQSCFDADRRTYDPNVQRACQITIETILGENND